MGAPVMLEVPQTMIDPVLIAQLEYDRGLIPINIVPEADK